MILCEELYFDISVIGRKPDLQKFISFLKSGELDDFFEVSPEYIDCEDDYYDANDNTSLKVTFTNDDYGIEIDEFDTDEFLETFCKAGKSLHIKGILYDADGDEYEFLSEEGDSYYVNARKSRKFNEDEDD